MLGCLCVSWWNLLSNAFPSSSWLWSIQCRPQDLSPFSALNFTCFSPAILPPPNHGTSDLVLWMLQKRSESLLLYPMHLGELSARSAALPFPGGRNHRLGSCCLALNCAALGEGWCGTLTLYLLPTIVHHFFFFSREVLELLLWKPWLLQRFSCLWVAKPAFSRYTWTVAKRVWNWFTGYCGNHCWYWGLSELLIDAQLGKTPPRYLGIGAGSHSSHRDAFVCGCFAEFLLLRRETEMKDT